MSQNGPFGIDPEDFDRLFRDAGDGIREALGRLGRADLYITESTYHYPGDGCC